MNAPPPTGSEQPMKVTTKSWRVVLALLLWIGVACKWMDSALPQGAGPTAASTTGQIATPAVDATMGPPTLKPAASQSPEETPAADAGGLVMVYTKTGELWRWKDGRAEKLELGGRAYAPRLSPDASKAAFLRPVNEFHLELWVVDLNDGSERRLVSVPELDAIGEASRDSSVVAINPYNFAWIPGEGQRLAFNTHMVYNGPGLVLLDDLHVVDAAGNTIQTVLPPGSGGEFAYSPDGSRVAIAQAERIFLANADGSELRQVMGYSQVLTYSEYRFYAVPKWSPDGSFLRVAIPPADVLADPAAQTALWRIPAQGGEPEREGGVVAVPFFDAPVVYSPDLQRVAYITDGGAVGEEARALNLATFDGRGEWQAAKESMLRFSGWSPDNRSFAYTAGDEMAVFLGSLDAPARSLGELCSGAVELRWVDASRMVCAVQTTGAFELNLVNVNGDGLLLDTIAGDSPVFDLRIPGQ